MSCPRTAVAVGRTVNTFSSNTECFARELNAIRLLSEAAIRLSQEESRVYDLSIDATFC